MSKSNEIFEVIIIGSGPCGIAIADELRTQQISSIILEAGSLPPTEFGNIYSNIDEYRRLLEPCMTVDESYWQFESNNSDYDWIRVRSAGGRSLRWNGWLSRPSKANFYRPGTTEWFWPLSEERIDSLLDRSEVFLGATESILSERFSDLAEHIDCDVLPKIAAMSTNTIRPLSSLDKIKAHPEFNIKYNSITTKLLCLKDGVKGVTYHNTTNGTNHELHAKVVVVCASAIETTRLLLSSELEKLTAAHPNIGKNYTDHIAASFLAILPEKFSGKRKLAGPLECAATVPFPKNSQRHTMQQGGFTLELHGPNPASIYEPEILEAANLQNNEYNSSSFININAIGEICSSSEHYITLSEKMDRIGRKIPKIHITWNDEIRSLAEAMETEAERVANIIASPDGKVIKARKTLTLGGTGVSHEAGTCSIGASHENSVVNLDGQVHGIPGLFVGDSSLMPSGLDCHPTLTVVALALNTADGIVKYINN